MQVHQVASVQPIIDDIIKNGNFKSSPEVDVTQGSEAGDGYASKTYAISIRDKNERNVKLFVKCLPEIKAGDEWKQTFAKHFRGELKFYQEIYPMFNEFQMKKNIRKPFDNVPKHYKVNINNFDVPPIVLENLRSLGYTLRDRKKPIDDIHLKLPIQAFARYHAISYAMKDQEPKVFETLSADMVDTFSENFQKFGMHKMLTSCVKQFVDSLNPIDDQELLNHCSNLSNVIIQHLKDIPKCSDEYAVIGQGDCWSNNMMFLYDNETGLPIDVKLVDWQCQRVNSPLLDFSYFFYTLATKEVLDNADHYLNLYYETLSETITELGSDPEKMYPYKVFMEHWKKCALFGLTMAFFIVKAQLFEKDETPDFINSAEPSVDSFSIVLKNQDKYITRMKDTVEYFIDKGLL